MTKKAAIIFNPSSGKERSDYYKDIILQKIKHEFEDVVIKETQGKNDATEFSKEFTDNFYDSIFVVGGDGTFNEAIKGILISKNSKKSKVGLIPGGTGNIFCSVLGFSRFARLAVDQIDLGHTKLLDVGCVNKDNFNMMYSIGDVPESIHNVSIEDKTSLSMIAYVKSMLRGAAKNNLYDLRIYLDDKIYSGNFSHVVIMTSQVLERFSPVDIHEKSNRGFLHVFMLKETDFYQKAALLPDIMLSRVEYNENIIYERSKNIEIYSLEENIQTDIDGDNAGSLPSKLHIIEDAIEVYTPKNFTLI